MQTLDLSSNSIGRPGAEALSAAFMLNSTLTAVDLSACGIDAASSASLVHALRHMPCLASLSLSENNVGDAAGSVIAAWLNASPRLARLALSRCGFTKSTAVKLGDALERNRWLTDVRAAVNEG